MNHMMMTIHQGVPWVL